MIKDNTKTKRKLTMTESETPQSRGRPPTGEAKSSNERGKAMESALIASGGRVMSRVRISAEAASALAKLVRKHGTERAAIEYALMHVGK